MENQKDELKKFYIKKEFNKLGDVSKIYYYTDINSDNKTFINLAFKETIITARNQNTGIPLNRNTIKEQIKVEEVIDSTNFVENFNKAKGIIINQESRSNLVDIASEYLLEDLITEYGEIDGLTKAKTFLDTVVTEREKYILSITIDLINAIDNTTLDFITTARKTKLKEILNVKY